MNQQVGRGAAGMAAVVGVFTAIALAPLGGAHAQLPPNSSVAECAPASDMSTMPVLAPCTLSTPAAVLPPCPCDWNRDGILNSQDFYTFLNAFFTGKADFNQDGVTDTRDYFDFLQCLVAGCQ